MFTSHIQVGNRVAGLFDERLGFLFRNDKVFKIEPGFAFVAEPFCYQPVFGTPDSYVVHGVPLRVVKANL